MATAAAPPPVATRYHAASALVATKAAADAARVRPRGLRFAWEILARSQVRQAAVAVEAVDLMLRQQDIAAEPEASLFAPAFTTSPDMFGAMVEEVDVDAEFERLVASLVQDAARAAQSVTTATRPRIGHVRHLDPPSCSRCAVLAGRVYRWSEGFERHPGCDCVMIPTTLSNPDLVHDPVELARKGQVTGLSKADRRAILEHGADFGQVVNVRQRSAGLHESGRILARAGRMTPEGIYRAAGDDQEAALELLAANGYLI